MQPTLLTAIPSRLDLPDPGRCSECKLPAAKPVRVRRRARKAAARRR